MNKQANTPKNKGLEHDPPTRNPVHGKYRVIICLSILILFNILLRMYFFVGLNRSDTPVYLDRILQLVYGNYKEGYERTFFGVFGSRLMMTIPPYLIIKIFGLNQLTVVSHSMICSLLLIPLVYKTSRLFYDENTGLLAAFLAGIVPFNIIWASWLMPDIPLEFYMTLAAYFLLRGWMKKEGRAICFLLSGVAIGLSYLVKITGLMFFLVVAVISLRYFIRERRLEYRLVCVILGFIAILILQVVVLYLGGIGLENLGRVSAFYSDSLGRQSGIIMPSYASILFGFDWGEKKFDMVSFMTTYSFYAGSVYGFFGFAALISVLVLAYRRDKGSTEVMVWLLVIAIYMQFGTQSISFWDIKKQARFMSIVVPPAVILVSRFMMRLEGRSKPAFMALLIFMVSSSLFFAVNLWKFDTNNVLGYVYTHDFLKNKHGTFYAEENVHNYLLVYYSGELPLKYVPITMIDCKTVSDSYVIIARTPVYKHFLSNPAYDCIPHPPKAWTMEFDIRQNLPPGLDYTFPPVKIWKVP